MKKITKLLLAPFIAIATISTQNKVFAMQKAHLEELRKNEEELVKKLSVEEKAAYNCITKLISTADYNNTSSDKLIETYFVSVVKKLNYSEKIYQLRNALKRAKVVRHRPLEYKSQAKNICNAFQIYVMYWIKGNMYKAIENLGMMLFPDY